MMNEKGSRIQDKIQVAGQNTSIRTKGHKTEILDKSEIANPKSEIFKVLKPGTWNLKPATCL